MSAPPRTDWKTNCADPEATAAAAARLAEALRPGDIILLNGPLGAGKTHFTRALAAALGSTDHVSSPTYVLQKIYGLPPAAPRENLRRVVHYDAYRMQNVHELLELDFHAMAVDAVSVVEWGERFAAQLPEATVRVQIAPDADDETGFVRTVSVEFLSAHR